MDGTPYAGIEDIGMALLEDSAELLEYSTATPYVHSGQSPFMLLEVCAVELLESSMETPYRGCASLVQPAQKNEASENANFPQ